MGYWGGGLLNENTWGVRKKCWVETCLSSGGPALPRPALTFLPRRGTPPLAAFRSLLPGVHELSSSSSSPPGQGTTGLTIGGLTSGFLSSGFLTGGFLTSGSLTTDVIESVICSYNGGGGVIPGTSQV